MTNASIVPAAMDFFLAVPRYAQKAGSYALFYMPDAVDNIASKIFNGGSVIADATAQQTLNSTITNTSQVFVQSTAAALLENALREDGSPTATLSSWFGMMLDVAARMKNFGGFFSYLTSRWALITFTAAIMLNRTQFYASSREHLRLKWYMRLALYAAPIIAFLIQLLRILQAMKCQTSPDFASLRYGDPLKHIPVEFGADGGFLYRLSSQLLFWQDDMSCCVARQMSIRALDNDKTLLRGSMSLLFPFFITLCATQLMETMFCALQGKQPMPETGLTLFEHSLAFAECEAMLSNALGFGFWGVIKLNDAVLHSDSENSISTSSRSEVLQRLNVPPEVLLVCLISCLSHLSSATLSIAGLRDKVRLLNTGVWACCYMSAFAWSVSKILTNSTGNAIELGVLRFPSVIVVGFIPHLLILVGISVCAVIYSMALLVTALSIPTDSATGMSLRQRLAWAYNNLQANVQFSSSSDIRIKMSEDFYTTLLKVGFSILMAASEAVYLNEGSRVHVAQMTWVEQKRIDELNSSVKRRAPDVPAELLGEGIAKGVDFTDHHGATYGFSPYARERKSRPKKTDRDSSNADQMDTGLGVTQRSNRIQLTFEFMQRLFWLVAGMQAQIILNILRRLGIGRSPAWLLKIAGSIAAPEKASKPEALQRSESLKFWMLGANDSLTVAKDLDVDVELETRRKLQHIGSYTGEDGLAESLYSWWRSGGWFGDADSSGDFVAATHDDDATSVASASTSVDDEEALSESNGSGRLTPTPQDPYSNRTDDHSPSTEVDLEMLTRLLNPKTPAERDEARLLSYSLQSSRPLTRSQYKRQTDRSRAQLLAGLHGGNAATSSEEEEERDLEEFLLCQRAKVKPKSTPGGTWESGAEGMGAGGPQSALINTASLQSFSSLEIDGNKALTPLYAATRLDCPDESGSVLQKFPKSINRFMQSEPTTLSPSTSNNGGHGISRAQDEDGFRHEDGAVALSPIGGPETVSTPARAAIQPPAAATLAAFTQTQVETPVPEDNGLRARKIPSPPAGRDRITDYEQAATPPIKKREGPGFEVIRKYRSPSDKTSPIQALPSEVLTHVLAHLSPTDLTSVAVVSKRFHDLVTGPHAWRSAFAHYFPGSDSLDKLFKDDDVDAQAVVRSERRSFSRLTAFATWRSEYIMRTRLLRSLGRGKPIQAIASPSAARSGHAHTAAPIIMYNSQLFTTVNHLHATYGTGLNKRLPRFIHGADDQGTATSSDPIAAKVDHWGTSDPQTFLQFSERFPGDAQYGLGPGEVVGLPNSMDVSQAYGMIHGEGSPGGMIYYRSTEEMRGRFLSVSSAMSEPEIGVPRISSTSEAACTVWIAKSAAIPSLTEGLVGMLSGSSLGVLTAYSLGATAGGSNRDTRYGRGEMTARWVLSPGIPLIAVAVDNDYSMQRFAQNRIWAVVLNALGEVYYLTKFPQRPRNERGTRLDNSALERLAWLTGRSVYWNIVEPTRRSAKPDPYADTASDASHSPRSSWNGMCLTKERILAEAHEVEVFATRKPKDFQKTCYGWDMRRRLEVDYAGDDGNHAGENVIVFECGLEEESVTSVRRYTRCRVQTPPTQEVSSTPPLTTGSTETSESPSLFGGEVPPASSPSPGFSFDNLEQLLSGEKMGGALTPRPLSEEWRTSTFSVGGTRSVQILTTTLDCSILALQTMSEDPLLSFSGRSAASSPSLTPISPTNPPSSPADMPGQRARMLAIGTQTGSVIIWDARAPISRSAEVSNFIEPIRVIYTDSPQISCLGLSSLYLVHGGNDGLVQAWDPLASNLQPIRTLNSRFSSRARRRLVQAQASPQGVGINLFAAGAISLDPDPTVLRGMVSLGTHLRYWSYSSSAADQYKSQKRRLRRSERGSNNGGERFSGVTRSNLKDYIANERFELDREKEQKRRSVDRYAGRFGTELLGSEEEMLAYAAMLSQESLEHEQMRRASDTSTAMSSIDATGGLAPAGSSSPFQRAVKTTEEELDPDIAEAIRQSLAPESIASHDIPLRSANKKGKKATPPQAAPFVSPAPGESSKALEMSDLDFAIQLSLAEERSKHDATISEVGESEQLSPAQPTTSSKGKGRRL